MKLTKEGEIVFNTIQNIPNHYDNVILDEFVMMPNHIHFVLGFNGVPVSSISGKQTLLSEIIKGFKKISMIEIKKYLKTNNDILSKSILNGGGVTASTIQEYGTIWQKSFYDHIIRDVEDLQRVREYIQNNPLQWELDEMNPRNYVSTLNGNVGVSSTKHDDVVITSTNHGGGVTASTKSNKYNLCQH
jgi:putative transposase